MYSEDELIRLKSISQKINDIYAIVGRHGGIVKALGDLERPLKIPCQSDSVPYTSGETNERNNKPTATSNSKVRL
jgi:hypothetical protein